MDILGPVKFASSVLIGSGVSTITKNIVDEVTPEDIGKFTKTSIAWASTAVAGVVAYTADKHMNKQFDELGNIIKGFVSKDEKPEVEETEDKAE